MRFSLETKRSRTVLERNQNFEDFEREEYRDLVFELHEFKRKLE